MRIITKRQKIKGVLDAWKKQYSKYPSNEMIKQHAITKELEELNFNNVSAKKINEIIGNNSWTELRCEECMEDKNKVVRFLERYEDEYEVNSCDLCLDCLKSGIKLFASRGN